MANTALAQVVASMAHRIISHTDELTALDQAIGDGDHGLNMKRGFEAVLEKLDALQQVSVADGLKTVGMTLLLKVGGASGPLYGTLAMTLGKELAGRDLDKGTITAAFGAAISAVGRRGKSEAGQKTMLDVLVPVHAALADGRGDDLEKLREVAKAAAAATIPMQAIKGRASYLGERSIGHMDPGARSSVLMIDAVCDVLEDAQ